jgi:hypothetical protein
MLKPSEGLKKNLCNPHPVVRNYGQTGKPNPRFFQTFADVRPREPRRAQD